MEAFVWEHSAAPGEGGVDGVVSCLDVVEARGWDGVMIPLSDQVMVSWLGRLAPGWEWWGGPGWDSVEALVWGHFEAPGWDDVADPFADQVMVSWLGTLAPVVPG